MRYLIYVLAFIPYAIGGPIGAQQGVLSFACRAASGGLMKIPIGDTRTSVTSSCSVIRSRVKKITDYPKAFTPGFNQKMLVTSKTRKFYISPLSTAKYPNAFAITTDECELAAVMMAGPRGLPSSQSATPPGAVTRPANSVRTRPGSPVAQSVRTVRPVVSRSESSAGKLEKRVVKGSDLTLCRPSTYDWDADVSGTGRQVGNIPVSGRRPSF